MSALSATNVRASGAESFARMRSVRSAPCGAPRAMFAARHTSSAASSSPGSMRRALTGRRRRPFESRGSRSTPKQASRSGATPGSLLGEAHAALKLRPDKRALCPLISFRWQR